MAPMRSMGDLVNNRAEFFQFVSIVGETLTRMRALADALRQGYSWIVLLFVISMTTNILDVLSKIVGR
jgi:hypothetical protein